MGDSASAARNGMSRLRAGDFLCTGRPGSSLRQYIALHLDLAQFAPQVHRLLTTVHICRAQGQISLHAICGAFIPALLTQLRVLGPLRPLSKQSVTVWAKNPQTSGSRQQAMMACPTGIEPVTTSLEGWCSIQLSYGQPHKNCVGRYRFCFICGALGDVFQAV